MNFLTNLEPLILVFHFIICIFLIVVILLQAGKGADMGATFGAGGSQSFFGARGAATFLSKLTTAAAIGFLLTSLSLAAIHKKRPIKDLENSVVNQLSEEKKPDAKPEESSSPQSPAPVVPASEKAPANGEGK